MRAPTKRSLLIRGHRTSVSLEQPFWEALKAMAAAKGETVGALVARIDAERGPAGLSSAIRVRVLEHFRSVRATAPGASS